MSIQDPKLEHLSEEARAFWEEKQQEIGETLVKFSYSILVEPTGFPPSEKNGILYLMEQSLWFEDFPKPPVFFFTKPTKYEKTCFHIPLSSIDAVELVGKSTFEERFFGRKSASGFLRTLQGLFNREQMYLIVSAAQDGNDRNHYIFRELDEPEAWSQLLETRGFHAVPDSDLEV